MKNLVNRLDRLENLPSRQKYRVKVDGNLKITYSDDNRKWRNASEHTVHRHIDGIIRAGVGKRWNDVHSKICKLVNTLNFYFDRRWGYSDVAMPFLSTTTGRWEFIERWGKSKDLQDYIERTASTRYWRKDFYWVCPHTGILKSIKSLPKPKPSKEEYRKQYEIESKRKKERRIRREEKERAALAELSMINQPQLFEFYRKLTADRAAYQKQANEKTYPWRNDKFARLWDRIYKKDAEKAKQKLIPIENQIRELEAGNFNIFFESNVYLYSLQKECHHFATP